MYKLTNSEEDLRLLEDYLKQVDTDFLIPISQKAVISVFAKKLLEFGHVVAIMEDNEIVAIVAYYRNDLQNNYAYLPILSTLKKVRGRGYARRMIEYMIDDCKGAGVKVIFCESVNPVAVKLYISCGFGIYETVTDNVHNCLSHRLKLEL